MVVIRNARTDELPELAKIVSDASRYWGYPEDWVTKHAQSISFDPISDVFVAEESDEVRGFYRRSNDQSKPEELWVAPAHFGTGVGKELFLHAMDRREL